jgi:hypothetical protein
MDLMIFKIYKLFTPDGKLAYYGSTRLDLRKKLIILKKQSEVGRYTSASELFESGQLIDIVLVERVYNTKAYIKKRKQHYIESFDCVNKKLWSNSMCFDSNTERIAAYQREYYELNREAIKASVKAYKKQIRNKNIAII